jgi:hypothetical protein
MEVPNGNALVSLACLWAFFYQVSIGPMVYNYLGEIPTQRLKSNTASLGFVLYAALHIMFSYITPYMLSPLEWGWGLKTGEYCRFHSLSRQHYFSESHALLRSWRWCSWPWK